MKMLLRDSVPLLLLLLSSFDNIECRKKSTSLTDRHTSHTNPVHLSYGRPNTISRTTTRRHFIQTTTPRYSYRTTTRKRYVTTTRKRRITTTPTYMTTTPRAATRYTTTRKTTRRILYETTTPKKTYTQTTTPRLRRNSTRASNTATTLMGRPPPFNPFFSTSKPQVAHTKPPPYNPFFSTTRVLPVNRQPDFSHYFTTSTRPPILVTNKTTPIPRQPAYNPYFTSSIPPVSSKLNKTSMIKPSAIKTALNSSESRGNPIPRQPAYNPYFTSSIPPVSSKLNKTSMIKPTAIETALNSSESRGNPLHRQPAYNPFVRSSIPPVPSSFNNTLKIKPPVGKTALNSSELPISGGLNKTFVTKLPPHNSTSNSYKRLNQTSLNKTPTYNSSINSHGYPVSGGFNKTLPIKLPTHNSSSTSLSPLVSGGSNKSSDSNHFNPNPPFISSRPPISGRLNKTSIKEPLPLNSFTTYRPPLAGKINKTSKGHLETGTGQNRNITSNFGHLPNLPQGNGYPTYPTNPGPNNMGNYIPGGGYNPGGHPNHQSAGLTIINNNQNNYNHQVIYPSQHYGGYGRVPSGVTITNNNFEYIYPDPPRPSYHYTRHDTGGTLLGAYLGYKLGQISRPTYFYHGTSIVNNKYVPVYDHYEVHHYYHNKDSIPREAEITANTIVTCAGDSAILCPGNTSTLCTNNGAVLCISSNVVPCDKENNMNCVRSSVPCLDNYSSRECEQKRAASISIPCVSTAKINGVFDVSNNTLGFRSDLKDGTPSFCVVIAALPAEKKLPKPKKLKAEISVPFHYTTNDSGIDPLGYYLGQKLEDLESPSYLYLNYDKNYRYKEKYDHYDIHQYYHNGTIMPREIEIKPDAVMTCAGDSGTICPSNTRSLCFTDGSVACVTDIESASFENDTKLNYGYVNTLIPCENSTSPFCRDINSTISISIPCISIAKIYTNVSNLISSFVTYDGRTKYYNTLAFQPTNSTNNATVSTKSTPRRFCVTVLLTPSEKVSYKSPSKRKVTGPKNRKTYMMVPSYTYSSNETGTNTLGFYLSQRLKDLKYPTYYFMPQNESVLKFDHYSVHQYYQGREIIPSEMDLQAESISTCAGDSGTLCPANTTTLCLNDWSVMCVTDVLLTRQCEKTEGTNCVRSTLPCLNRNAPKCTKGVERVRVTMPCISIVTVFGDVMYVNNSIYTSDNTKLQSYISLQQIPNRKSNVSASNYGVQQFCVTIVALPAERRISEGEKILESSKNVFLNFALNMFGIS